MAWKRLDLLGCLDTSNKSGYRFLFPLGGYLKDRVRKPQTAGKGLLIMLEEVSLPEHPRRLAEGARRL